MTEPSSETTKVPDFSSTDPVISPEADVLTDTSEEASAGEYCRDFRYRHRSSDSSDNDEDDDEDDEEDPYCELFMNAYRSAPASSDEGDEEQCTNENINLPEAKPLSLMEDWDLWDYMNESELKERLKDHPRLFEEITRKRKRKLADEEEDAGNADEDLSDMMNRFVKYIRADPTNVTG
ncbi:nucleolin-like [Anopheles ziemanni]|uniref:nucleolin-like n=1 Tax=Anopheles coustani TaxID=139045 RepID=UPI0026586CF5|nr:nucleolin-like [Anopheles coustani]XP_058178029.1 nucleolin-like [Anopheles ziemanni]